MQPISLILPVLDAGAQLDATLQPLQALRARGHELIVVDGGSRDGSLTLARRLADRVVMSGAGRALQLNAGAEHARHEVLLFLQLGLQLPQDADQLIAAALAPQAARWGRFDLRLAHSHPAYRLLERGINWRSRLDGIALAEQAIFVEREYFERVGCFDRLPLFEELTLSRKLLHFAPPACIDTPVLASAQRWQRDGVLRTLLREWRLRAAFRLGADPFTLARRLSDAAAERD